MFFVNMKNFLIIIKMTLIKTFPAKIISSFLGIGYLPNWQNYWSSFLILFITDIILIFTHGINFILYGMPDSGIIIGITFFKVAIFMLILQLIGISIFHIQDPLANSSENIVIQVASGQVLTVALSVPAVMSIYYNISKLYGIICKQILKCPFWFNDFMHLFFFFIIPYTFFNFIEVIKLWPIDLIQLNYNNAISITLETISNTFYTVILLYLIAFILCDLTIHNAIVINKSIIHCLN